MSAHTQTSIKAPATSTSTFTPVPSGLLQRKCACGGTPGMDGECEECRAKRLRVQPKLAISQSDDIYEREADRIADEIVRADTNGLGVSQAQSLSYSALKPSVSVQRQDEEVVEEGESTEQNIDEVSNDTDLLGDEDEDSIVADETGRPKLEAGVVSPSSSASVSLRIPLGVGRPMDLNVRNFMEQRFGHDFNRVRIHTDEQAVSSARHLRAHAYTVGSNIYFNEERYNPNDREGLRLLAHELTHVVQQTGYHPSKPFTEYQVQRKEATQEKKKVPPCKSGECAAQKAPLLHDDCQEGEPPNKNNFLRHLKVSRAGHTVDAIWGPDNRDPKTATKATRWPCSPSTTSGDDGKIPTPLGPDKVGLKCSSCHTNGHRAGMAWFTGLASKGIQIGFHDSQPVGASFESHGCIRVNCGPAKTINQETWSRHTTIEIVK